ncbi:phosphoglycerate kinase [Candidatus Saccharibacteria bacterium]|nr:phosphoglycerate kinase [Candidatus Saccharibacteria bacterium]
MSFNKKTIKDVGLADKVILLRADYNLPDIDSDYRIKQSVPTIEYILKQRPKLLVIISHLGRPKKVDKELSLQPIARHLGRLLNRRVYFAPDCIGDEVKDVVSRLKDGDVLMLENLRFHAGEEQNSPEFAKALIDATGAEMFVQDGFGVVHRAHASTDAITRLLPSVAGLLLEREVETITEVMKNPERPLVAVIGGAKISDKLEVMNRLVELADCVAVGGAMANNFLKIRGYAIGHSLYDKDDLKLAREVLGKAEAKSRKQSFSFLLPVDAVVSKTVDGRSSTRIVDLASHTISDIEAYPRIPKPAAYNVGQNEAIVDIGPVSAAKIAGRLGLAKTVIWNGTLGVAEVHGIAGAHAPFAHGTRVVADAMIGPHNRHPIKPFSLVGGGDTSGYVESAGLIDDFDHVSTGGGASLELMAGKQLPGIEALLDKN